MKRINIVIIYAILSMLAMPVTVAHADGIIMAPPTQPVSQEINDAVMGAIAAAPPAETNIYAISNISQYENGYMVSVVGLDIAYPYDTWSLEDGQAVWLGTVRIYEDGSAEIYNIAEAYEEARRPARLAAMRPVRLFGAGGGPQIYLPFQIGTRMMYGLRGVHGLGDFGTSGMYAVDLVGSDTMTGNVAPPSAYASASGVIDYVCDDGTSVAVRIVDAVTEDEFLYAHLVDNANLEEDVAFNKGQFIASITYGTFSDTCGWASQSPESYHLHWMFTPSSDYFQAEGYILDLSTEVWTKGDSTIDIYGWLTAEGGSSDYYTDPDDPTAPPVMEVDPTDPASISLGGGHIWDFVVMGLFQFVSGLTSGMPDAESDHEFMTGLTNIITTTIQQANILFPGIVSVWPILLLVGFMIASEGVYLIWVVIRAIDKLPMVP